MTFARAWAHIAEVAILTDPGGSVLPPTARCRSSGSRRGCDPHRPRRVGAAALRAGPPTGGRTVLRSSPTPEGRCCPGRAGICGWSRGCDPHRPRRVGAARRSSARRARRRTVAILTDPGGSVLLASGLESLAVAAHSLRSSPTPEGRCCLPARRGVEAADAEVAILTDPGGSVLRVGHAPPHVEPVGVAILTDPGGSVLPGSTPPSPKTPTGLRSSPTPEGRCCAVNDPLSDPLTPWLRSSPTPEGRCCKSALTPS